MLLCLFGFLTEPMAPPPEQHTELCLSKEGLPGKELEIVSEDEDGQRHLLFVGQAELLQDVLLPMQIKRKRKSADCCCKKIAVNKQKNALNNYNRRGKRHK